MLLATTDEVTGRQITEVLGLVSGNAVQARNVGRDMLAGLKNITGGEVSGYRDLLIEARGYAIDRMVKEAEELGADAVVGMRLSTAEVMQGTAEILAYGTAVRLG